MRKKSLTLLFTGVLLLSAIIPTIGSKEPTDLKHLIKDDIAEPSTLDPAWALDKTSCELLWNIYETLIRFKANYTDKFDPLLADTWHYTAIDEYSPEGILWVGRMYFHPRTDVSIYFHDAPENGPGGIPGEGEQLTLADIEYSFERFLITDKDTGAAWKLHWPLHGGYSMYDLNDTLTALGWPINPFTGWNTKCDEAIDHAIQSNATHVWFNLVFPIPDILCQVIAMPWCGILSETWCTQHLVDDFPGIEVGDGWAFYHDPPISPIDAQSTGSPGPNLDAALGTGPYQLDYWNKGAVGLWSVRANSEALGHAVLGKEYWRHWFISLQKPDYLDRFSSYYIPEWATRKLRFLACISDITHVPTECIDEIRISKTGGAPEENFEQYQPGIRCDWGTWNGTHFTPYLALKLKNTIFFNFLVAITTTHLGIIQPPGVFNELGAPPNIFNDTKTRQAFTYMLNYSEYSETAYHNESIAPVTPIIRGLSPSPPGGWPADAKVGDMALAIQYLKEAWSGSVQNPGPLWTNGFTMDFVYNKGNVEREIACIMLRDAFEWINTNHGTKFHTNVVSVTWEKYLAELRARTLPFFFADWEANLADAHFAAYDFMHSEGIANGQGYVGVTEFPNEEVDGHVEAAVNTTVFAERLGNYTWLRNYYKENAPGSPLAQPIKRHWRKDWVGGWVFNPITDGMHYAYDLWKQLPSLPIKIDLSAIGSITHVGGSMIILLGPSPCIIKGDFPEKTHIDVKVHRLDLTGPFCVAIIGLVGRNNTGYTAVLDTDLKTMGPGSTAIAVFDRWDEGNLPPNRLYSMSGEVWPIGNYNDTDPTNNIVYDRGMASLVDADFDDDGHITYDDIVSFVTCYIMYWSVPSRYDPTNDLDSDGDIDYDDILLFVSAYILYWSLDP